jgi:hypothetical protein
MLLMFVLKKMFDKKPVIAILLTIFTTAFEIYENLPKQIVKYHRIEVDSTGESSYRGDSTINIAGDIIFNMMGIYIGYKVDNLTHAILILLIKSVIITKTIGFNYWTESFSFMTKEKLW